MLDSCNINMLKNYYRHVILQQTFPLAKNTTITNSHKPMHNSRLICNTPTNLNFTRYLQNFKSILEYHSQLPNPTTPPKLLTVKPYIKLISTVSASYTENAK